MLYSSAAHYDCVPKRNGGSTRKAALLPDAAMGRTCGLLYSCRRAIGGSTAAARRAEPRSRSARPQPTRPAPWRPRGRPSAPPETGRGFRPAFRYHAPALPDGAARGHQDSRSPEPSTSRSPGWRGPMHAHGFRSGAYSARGKSTKTAGEPRAAGNPLSVQASALYLQRKASGPDDINPKEKTHG
jgi:hypothetical protein